MLRKVLSVSLLLAALLALPVHAQFYYGSEGTIPLYVDSSKVTIKFDELLSPSSQQELIESIYRIVETLEDDNMIDDFVTCSLSTGDGYGPFLDSLDTIPGIYLVEPYYLFDGGDPFVVGQHFCVAFDTTLTAAEIASINSFYGVDVDRELYGMPNVYLLENTDETGLRMLDLANAYHERTDVYYAHPDFGVRIEPDDYKPGDANNDGAVNVGDAVYIKAFAFQGGPEPKPDILTGDANCDGNCSVGDVIFLIDYVFKGGPPPGICVE